MVDQISGWRINSLLFTDVAQAVVLDSEAGGAIADRGHEIPGRPGVLTDDAADYGPLILPLRVALRRTDATGDVIHADGEQGHYFENLSKIKREFRRRSLSVLRRNVPHVGSVRALCKLTTDPFPGPFPVYNFPLLVPSGSWQSFSEDSATGNPPVVVTGGDTEIHDPRLSISAPGETEFTLSDGTVYTIIAAAGPTYPIVVNVGAGTVKANGGAGIEVPGSVTFLHEHWFRLEANATASITTDNTVTVFWRNRWS